MDLALLIFTHLGPVVLMIIIHLSLLPVTMTKLTLITNIEMMKDSTLIEKVIASQKLEKSKRSNRIFQVMKLIRRELAEGLKK